MWFVVILGIIAFLAFEHPIALFLVFLPLALMFILAAVNWVRKGSFEFKHITTAVVVFFVMVAALLIVCIP